MHWVQNSPLFPSVHFDYCPLLCFFVFAQINGLLRNPFYPSQEIGSVSKKHAISSGLSFVTPKTIFPILSDSVFHLSPVAPNSPLPWCQLLRKFIGLIRVLLWLTAPSYIKQPFHIDQDNWSSNPTVPPGEIDIKNGQTLSPEAIRKENEQHRGMKCHKQEELKWWMKKKLLTDLWICENQTWEECRFCFSFPLPVFFTWWWCCWHNCLLSGKCLQILWMSWCILGHWKQIEWWLYIYFSHAFWWQLEFIEPFILHIKLIEHNLPWSWALKSR